MNEEEFATSAECREMKHKWCYGQAFDVEADEETACQCNCHEPEESIIQEGVAA
ncbi:hypothetical protein [Glutamicibacter sp. X7]